MPLVVRQESWPTQSISSTGFSSSDALSEHSSRIPPTYHSPPPCERSNSRVEGFQEDTYAEKNEYHRHPSPWTSHDPYASTTSSIDDSDDDLPPFEIPEHDSQSTIPSVFAATPREFADYFPSMHRMSIKHDDTTDDGNMNLRIDTVAPSSAEWKPELTLFHLRMYDLKDRDFSLRRYCRDSGKEICHSRRKFLKPSVVRRPVLQRSMGNALSNLRPNSGNKTTKVETLKRQDSGYDSMSDEEDGESLAIQSPSRADDITSPSNTITFEFSNYAHLEVKRRGAKSSKRYDFEYWGIKYAWKRATIRSGSFNETSYHLVDSSSHNAVAHIVPVPLSNAEARDEEAKGGWVPPCSMWISEEGILDRSTDVADVIVATGLIALVDDCIKRRWHHKGQVQITMPNLLLSPLKVGMDYFGPKHLIDEVFNRGEKQSLQRSTHLRQRTF